MFLSQPMLKIIISDGIFVHLRSWRHLVCCSKGPHWKDLLWGAMLGASLWLGTPRAQGEYQPATTQGREWDDEGWRPKKVDPQLTLPETNIPFRPWKCFNAWKPVDVHWTFFCRQNFGAGELHPWSFNGWKLKKINWKKEIPFEKPIIFRFHVENLGGGSDMNFPWKTGRSDKFEGKRVLSSRICVADFFRYFTFFLFSGKRWSHPK